MSTTICANCGKGEEESGKLKNCTACMMVKYCNRECQIAHRPQHKKECKKRAAEIFDEKLFKQPPTKDCPICMIRLSSLHTGRRYMSCCGKEICSGCFHAPVYDDQGNEVDNQKCAFCRAPFPTEEEGLKREKKRMEANDPIAIYNTGCNYRDGTNGYPQDYKKALEFWHRAGEFGHTMAYLNIGYAYFHGTGVEVDKKKSVHYCELGAMRGDLEARYNLGITDQLALNIDRAIKHYMIAVSSGCTKSMKEIKELYSNGFATKDDYTKALQIYQTYLSEIKSSQRDEAAAYDDYFRYY